MTIEKHRSVRVPVSTAEKLSLLVQQFADAKHRYQVGSLGDRTEIVRAEQLASQIEGIAYAQLLDDKNASEGTTVISLTWPFAEGAATQLPAGAGERPPAEVWRASRERSSRTQATYERFAAQLAAWADNGVDVSSLRPVCPSEVQNRALTEALREYAATRQGTKPVDATVTYRDGSSGPPFPLRTVPISDVEPQDGREVIAMTLLSVRHLEMDVDVDGAWLRNREISLPRPAGITDLIAYTQSLQQFKVISASGPITLHLYQTGLPPAVVGFYRALIEHNRDPRNYPVAVVPFYFAGNESYVKSEAPWTIG